MPTRELTNFLDANRVKYTTIKHSPAYTAQELAATTHVSGKEVAKTIMVNVDGKAVMAVVPSPSKLDLQRLREAAGGKATSLLTESEFAGRFSGCELGAMPPFGNLYGMDVYVDEKLADDAEIVFNAGTHTEAMRLPYADFERLVKPKVAQLARAD
jgi:Ala-tRNA(Pro) deacylase